MNRRIIGILLLAILITAALMVIATEIAGHGLLWLQTLPDSKARWIVPAAILFIAVGGLVRYLRRKRGTPS
jgi:hypothetical protein